MKPFYYINNATIGEFTGDKFDTLERATEESLELAEANPGQSFEILKCVGHSSTSNASTFWMDGEGPPLKPRYRFLDLDEEVLPGDQYSSDGFAWHDVPGAGYYIDEFCATHRRPL